MRHSHPQQSPNSYYSLAVILSLCLTRGVLPLVGEWCHYAHFYFNFTHTPTPPSKTTKAPGLDSNTTRHPCFIFYILWCSSAHANGTPPPRSIRHISVVFQGIFPKFCQLTSGYFRVPWAEFYLNQRGTAPVHVQKNNRILSSLILVLFVYFYTDLCQGSLIMSIDSKMYLFE